MSTISFLLFITLIAVLFYLLGYIRGHINAMQSMDPPSETNDWRNKRS